MWDHKEKLNLTEQLLKRIRKILKGNSKKLGHFRGNEGIVKSRTAVSKRAGQSTHRNPLKKARGGTVDDLEKKLVGVFRRPEETPGGSE